jgi:hypothetical protein
MMLFQAVLVWGGGWWLIDLFDAEPAGTGLAVLFSFTGLGLVTGSATSGVHQPSPLPSMAG